MRPLIAASSRFTKAYTVLVALFLSRHESCSNSSFDAVPLQGADMFAWEINRYAHAWLKAGGDSAERRPHLKALVRGIKADVQFADRAVVELTVANAERHPLLHHIADFFENG